MKPLATVFVLCTLGSGSALAAEDSKFYLTLSGVSYHASAHNLNGTNLGIGLEYGTEKLRWGGGAYRNSYNVQTMYAGVRYVPVEVTSSVRAGVVGMVATGYKYPLLGALTLESDPLRFLFVPRWKDSPATFALQLQFCLE